MEERHRMPQPGEIVAGRYEIVREAGRGGMSVVYEAADRKLGGKRRALKALRPETRRAEAGASAELDVLQKIDHPRLPQVIDVILPAGGRPLMLVTDFVRGEPLAAALRREGGGMDARRAAEIAAELCEALAYLHGLNPPVVHLDVKPSNVMLDPARGVRLIDFGISRLLGKESAGGPRLGTPGFAAPEQAAGAPCGPAADVYAAGALLYWLLSGGRTPKPGERRFRRLAGVPGPLLDALARMLARDPACRPGARQAAVLLRQAAGGTGESAGPLAAHGGADRSAGRPLPRLVAVASFSRGAGATTLAVLLAERLARRRPTALVEMPGGEPELLAMLVGAGALGPDGRPAPPPASRRHVCWLAGPSLQVHALHPDQDEPDPDSPDIRAGHAADVEASAILAPERFRFPEISPAEPPLIVADLSSGWIAGGCRAAAEACDLLLMIADPAVWRWTAVRRSAWRELVRRRESAGLKSLWIANRDGGFPHRSDWLGLMPQQPAVCVPLFPPGEWTSAVWAGGPFGNGGHAFDPVVKRLGPVVDLMLDG